MSGINCEFSVLHWQRYLSGKPYVGGDIFCQLHNCTHLNYALVVTGLIILQLSDTKYGNAAKRWLFSCVWCSVTFEDSAHCRPSYETALIGMWVSLSMSYQLKGLNNHFNLLFILTALNGIWFLLLVQLSRLTQKYKGMSIFYPIAGHQGPEEKKGYSFTLSLICALDEDG